jgi:type IV secretion system protein TrbB
MLLEEGTQGMQQEITDRARRKLDRDLGPVLLEALSDPHTVEVLLNADGRLWQEKIGKPMTCIGEMSPARAQAVIELIAGYHGKVVTRSGPLLEGELPDGSRFAGQLPPIVAAPTFAIRKRASAIFPLGDYVAAGILTARHHAVLREAIERRRSVVVAGGTGSGKTTLVNAIIQEVVRQRPEERLILIEDTVELQCSAQNCVQFHTTADVSMTALLRTTLRMRPDRILVGEVRGPEALDLLMAWNTGHEGGIATLHSNSARSALDRLQLLVSMHPQAPRPMEPLIASAVDLIVYIARTPCGRRVQEVLEVKGYERGEYVLESIAGDGDDSEKGRNG